MRYLKSVGLPAILAVALLAGAPALAADPEGAVEGALSNGTAGGKTVAGVVVTLAVLANGAERETRQVTADALGRYRFEGLPRDTAYSYQVRAEFEGIGYNLAPAQFPPGRATLPLNLTVYETTDSPAALRMDRADIIVTVADGLLTVWEHYMVVNGGDRTYTGDQTADPKARTTLQFVLPRNAGPPDLLEGFDRTKAIVTQQAVFDTRPVLPGAKDLFFVYHVGYTAEAYTVKRPMLYPVKRADLLLQSVDLGLTSQRLTWEPPTTIEGRQFQRLSGADLARGEVIDFTLSGLPVPRQQDYIRAAGLVLAVGGVGFVVAYGVRRRSLSLREERKDCLRGMADLDDQHDRGGLSDEEYRTRRAALKARLLEMTRTSAGRRESPDGP